MLVPCYISTSAIDLGTNHLFRLLDKTLLYTHHSLSSTQMKTAVIVWFALAVCAWALPAQKEDELDVIWEKFKDMYGKVYDTAEEEVMR